MLNLAKSKKYFCAVAIIDDSIYVDNQKGKLTLMISVWHNRRFRASSVRPFSPPRLTPQPARSDVLRSVSSLENVSVESKVTNRKKVISVSGSSDESDSSDDTDTSESDSCHTELELLEKEQERIRAQLRSLEEEEEICLEEKGMIRHPIFQ